MRTTKRSFLVAGAALAALASTAAIAQFAPKPLAPLVMTSEPGRRSLVSRHTGTFHGQTIRYWSEVSETIIKDAGGKSTVSMIATAYIAEGVKDPAARPVVFAFNGGPGASAVFLQLGSMAPRIVKDVEDPRGPLIDNPQSPLDEMDLVFLDPPESGYSRILPGAETSQFASIDGDAEVMAQVVINWLRSHGRLNSPVHLYGESYGTMRAVAMARDLRRGEPSVAVAGLMLGGNSLGYFQKGQMPDILFAANALPMMASVAWYHGKIDRAQSWTQAIDKARAFARTEYISALMQGYRLSPAERDRVIARLPALIGIPEENFRKSGSIVPADFKAELMADQGLIVDSNDGRLTHAADDKAGGRDFKAFVGAYGSIMDKYVADELKASGLAGYNAFNPVLLPGWNYYTTGAMALDVTLATEMKHNPALHVLLVQGRYDTLTTLGNSEYIMRQADLDWARYGEAYYDGGHTLLPEAEIMDALRAFVKKR
jgi:Carboxypeptidase C (cathepsin A)